MHGTYKGSGSRLRQRAGTQCIYVPPGLNGPGSEKPSIDSTFA